MDLTGNVIIVTGSNTGIGKPTVRVLASHGATVVMACRSQQRAAAAKSDIIRRLTDPEGDAINFKNLSSDQLEQSIDIIVLDLSSLESIAKFAEEFLSKYSSLNQLVLNAGMLTPQWMPTVDGIEMQFGVNHLGHQYLTSLLTPILIKSAKSGTISRIISVSSNAGNSLAPSPLRPYFETEDLIQNKDAEYDMMRRYGLTKAANIMFAKEFERRFSADGVHAISLHPGLCTFNQYPWTQLTWSLVCRTGLISTEIARNFPPYLKRSASIFVALFAKSLDQGAATTVRTVAMSDELFVQKGGAYFMNCQEFESSMWIRKLNPDCQDPELQSMLWEMTEKMINDRIQ